METVRGGYPPCLIYMLFYELNLTKCREWLKWFLCFHYEWLPGKEKWIREKKNMGLSFYLKNRWVFSYRDTEAHVIVRIQGSIEICIYKSSDFCKPLIFRDSKKLKVYFITAWRALSSLFKLSGNSFYILDWLRPSSHSLCAPKYIKLSFP